MQHMTTLSLDHPPRERSPIYQRRPGSSTQTSPAMESHHIDEDIPSRQESPAEFMHQHHQMKRPVKNFLVNKRLPNWGGGLPENAWENLWIFCVFCNESVFQFLDRLRYFEERSLQQRENLIAQQCQEKSEKIEQCLASEYKLKVDGNEDDEMYNALQGKIVITVMIILFSLSLIFFHL